MEQTRDIYLHGRLGRKYGKHHRIAVGSPAECVRALSILLNAEEDLKRGDYRFIVGEKDSGISVRDEDVSRLRFNPQKSFHLVPNTRASGLEISALTWVWIAIAALAVTTILLRPQVKTPTANERQDDKASFVFDGPINVTEQGHPVPLVYGQVRTGSVVVSAGIETTDISTDVLANGGGGSDGITNGFSGGPLDNVNDREVFAAKGGKGGGGQSRAAQEDPNSLQSQATARIVEAIAEGEIVGLVNGLKSVYLDDTPVQNSDNTFNFKGIAIEERVGLPDQAYMPGFAQQEASRSVGLEVTNVGGGVVQTVQNPDANRVRVTIRLNALSRQDTTNGDLLRTSVSCAIDVQPNGGGYTSLVQHEFNGKTTSAYQRSFDIQLPAGGFPWNIRVRRTSPDVESAATQDDIFFDILTEIVDAKLIYPDTAVIGLTVDAKQFGSNIPSRAYEIRGKIIEVPTNYNPETRVYTGVWDGLFKRAYSNNPAWIFRDICLNPRYGLGRRITADKIDKFGLYQIAQYCDQLVPDGKGGQEPRYTLNTTISDREEAYNVLQAIASNCRAIVYIAGGQIIMSQDAPQSPVKLVTPSNVHEEGFDYDDESLDNLYSAFVVSWNNPADNFRTNFEVVEDPDLVQRLGWKVKELTAFGCTSQGRARREGMWEIENQKYAASRVKYKTGFDHADLQPGRVVQIADPDNTLSRRGGRVVSATTTAITVDQPVALTSGTIFTLQVILPDGTIATRTVTNALGTHTVLNLGGALPAAPLPGAVWTLASNVVAPQQFRVSGIKETDTGEFQISAVAYDPGRFLRVENNVVVDPIPFTDIPTGPLLAPRTIRVREFLKQVGTAQVPSVAVSWTPEDDPRVVAFQMQVRRPGSLDFEQVYEGRAVSADVENTLTGNYSFRVRSIDGIGRFSPWRQLDQIIGGTGVDVINNPPGSDNSVIPDVTNLRAVLSDQVNQPYLEWLPPGNDPRQFVYEIWFTPDLTSEGTFARARRIEVTSSTRGRIVEIGRYWVRNSYLGRFSLNPPSVVAGSEIIPKVEYSTIINRPRSLQDLDPGTKATFDTVRAIADALVNNDAQKTIQITTLQDEIAGARGNAETLYARLNRIETTQVTQTGSQSAQVTELQAEVQSARGGSPTLAARLGLIDQAVVNGSTAQAQRIAVLEAGLFRGAGNANLLPNALFEIGITGIEQWRLMSTASGVSITTSRQGLAGSRVLRVSWANSNTSSRTIGSVGSNANAASAAPVVPGRLYGVGIRLRGVNGVGFSAQPTIRWLKADFTNSDFYVPPSLGLVGSAPQEAQTINGVAWASATAPTDAAYAIIEVFIYKSAAANTGAGHVEIDNPIICEVDPQATTPPAFNSNAFSRLATVDTTLFDGSNGLVSRVQSLETGFQNSNVGALSARIDDEIQARIDGDNANASQITSLQSIARFNPDGLNRNPVFNGAWVSGQIPENWNDWLNGANSTRVTGQFGPAAIQFSASAGQDQGILQSPPNIAAYVPGWYVIEADVTLISGTLRGAGVRVNVNNITTGQDALLNFITDPDINGNVQSAGGTINNTYRWRKLVQLTFTDPTNFFLYAISNWSTFDATRPTKNIVFHRVVLRTATDTEIEMRQARGGSTSLSARFTSITDTVSNFTTTVGTKVDELVAQVQFNPATPNAPGSSSGLRSLLTTQITAVADSVSTQTSRIDTLESVVGVNDQSGLRARIIAEEQTRAAADNTAASRLNVVEAGSTASAESINNNPNFGGVWAPGATNVVQRRPDRWNNWLNAAEPLQSFGFYSPKAVRFNTVAGQDMGLVQSTLAGTMPPYAPGWYVLEADIQLANAATLVGSGLLVQVMNGGTQVASAVLSFSADPDSTGAAPGAGNINQLYKYRKLVNLSYTGAFTDFLFYAMGSWSGFDATRPAKNIVFHRAAIRAATTQEIEVQRAIDGSGGSLNARVTTLAQAGVDAKNTLTSSYTVRVDAGGRVAGMQLLAANGTTTQTSSVTFNADVFRIFNGANGTPADPQAPFEVVGGQVRIREAAIGLVNVNKLVATGQPMNANMIVGNTAKIEIDGVNNRIVIYD